jgi:hypothetical protein
MSRGVTFQFVARAIEPGFPGPMAQRERTSCGSRRRIPRAVIGSEPRAQIRHRHNMRGRGREYHQRGVVNVTVCHRSEASIRIIAGRRRIRKEHDAVVPEHGIARRRMTAILGRRPDAKPMARVLLELQPGFTVSRLVSRPRSGWACWRVRCARWDCLNKDEGSVSRSTDAIADRMPAICRLALPARPERLGRTTPRAPTKCL